MAKLCKLSSGWVCRLRNQSSTGWTESNFTFSFAYNFFGIWDRPLHPLMKKCPYGGTFWFLQSRFLAKIFEIRTHHLLDHRTFWSNLLHKNPVISRSRVRILSKMHIFFIRYFKMFHHKDTFSSKEIVVYLLQQKSY